MFVIVALTASPLVSGMNKPLNLDTPSAASKIGHSTCRSDICSVRYSKPTTFRRQLKIHLFQLSYPHLIEVFDRFTGIVTVVLVVCSLFRLL